MLNRGLGVLGTDEYFGDYEMHAGVFEGSAVKRVDLPPTLKKIEYSAFKNCKSLKSIKLPVGLEAIGLCAFSGSGLESVTTPLSVRTICQGAFSDCKSLGKAVLNDGLEVLGTDEYPGKNDVYSGVFEQSGLSTIGLPRALRRIEYGAFRACQSLRDVRLPDALEVIGKSCFSKSGLEKFTSPVGLKRVGACAFEDCE